MHVKYEKQNKGWALRVFGGFVLIILSLAATRCGYAGEPIAYDRWTVTEPILRKGPPGSFDNVAVKDPSIVYYDGGYHLFYTGKSSQQAGDGLRYDIDAGYVAAPTLSGLKAARRYNFRDLTGEIVIAPQIFYFEPQKLWYLFGHTKVSGKPNLAPVYLTNPDIEDVEGWSRPNVLQTDKQTDEFWIDFWVICDENTAHLFYADQRGAILRMACPLEQFPVGFSHAREQTALTLKGEDEHGPWRVFEAQHVYHVKQSGDYLMVVECGYSHSEKTIVDPRRRFLIALSADKLTGPWKRIEDGKNAFFAEAANLYHEDGSKSDYTTVSHFELIRSGYNQKLEVDNDRLRIVFQSFDGSRFPDTYRYDALPWELAIMRNY